MLVLQKRDPSKPLPSFFLAFLFVLERFHLFKKKNNSSRIEVKEAKEAIKPS
jgi:hypothetical protein